MGQEDHSQARHNIKHQEWVGNEVLRAHHSPGGNSSWFEKNNDPSILKRQVFHFCFVYKFICFFSFFLRFHMITKRLAGGSEGKESACYAGDLGLIPWVGKIPWRKEWQLTPVLLPGQFYGQRSLVGSCPHGVAKTEQLGHIYKHIHGD